MHVDDESLTTTCDDRKLWANVLEYITSVKLLSHYIALLVGLQILLKLQLYWETKPNMFVCSL